MGERLLEKAGGSSSPSTRPRGSAKIPPGSSAGSATIMGSATARRPRLSPAGPACIRRPSKAAGTARATTGCSTRPTSAACPRHLFIPDLVPGEVSDAGEDFVSYRMRDGSTWTNDAREEEAAAC
jgi:hypothetical protein